MKAWTLQPEVQKSIQLERSVFEIRKFLNPKNSLNPEAAIIVKFAPKSADVKKSEKKYLNLNRCNSKR